MMRPPSPLLAHLDGGRARTEERPPKVRPHDQVEVLVGHLPEHGVAQDPRVRDHHVESPERLDRPRDQSVRHRAFAHVAGHDEGARTGEPRCLARARLVDVVHDDGGARVRQRHGVGAAEPLPGARDDGDLAR